MKWLRSSEQEPLTVSMAGVRLGDRLLVVGAGDPQLLAGVASKTGLTGRACVVDESETRTTAAVAAAERDGALVEGFAASNGTALPFGDSAFDVVILRNVLPGLDQGQRTVRLSETWRVLRPGGRALVIDGAERAGLQALFTRRTSREGSTEARETVLALEAAGFRAVRTLAERAGLVFTEGVRGKE